MLIERIGAVAVLVFVALAGASALAATSPGPVPAKDCALAGHDGQDATGASAEPVFPPVQLDIDVPLEPTLFPSGGFNYLIYEIHFQNYTGAPLPMQALEIVDAGGTSDRTIAAFTGARLHEQLRGIGGDSIDQTHPLEGGKRAVAFICLAFDDAGPVPKRLRHRVLVGGSVAEGPTIGTRHAELKVLAPPVAGTDWVADNGPSLDSHHRTGLFVAGGRAHLSRRFAIDWKRIKQGEAYAGDARDVRAYHAYDEKVFAVADAVVVSAKDGFPDNRPRTAAGFDTALPITAENVAGNSVVLDLGGGQFAYYAHLKPGSVRVRTGARVKRGEWLGRIGNSGDARWPHLHFQVTLGPDLLASEGLPFLIDHYRTRDANGTWQTRSREYPIGSIPIELDAAPVAPLERPERIARPR